VKSRITACRKQSLADDDKRRRVDRRSGFDCCDCRRFDSLLLTNGRLGLCRGENVSSPTFRCVHGSSSSIRGQDVANVFDSDRWGLRRRVRGISRRGVHLIFDYRRFDLCRRSRVVRGRSRVRDRRRRRNSFLATAMINHFAT